MEVLKKYQVIKQQIVSIAKKHSTDKRLMVELAEVENILLEIIKTPQQETEKYKMLFDNSGDYIFVVNHEGIILDVNSTACKKYNISYEEFINSSVLNIDVSEDKEYIQKKIDELLLVGSARFEAAHRSRDEKIFNVDVIAQKITWNNQPAILEICRDITEQKQLQKALNASEVKLKKIINQISDGIVIFEKDGRIVIWNSEAENLTGIKQEDAVGQYFFDVQYHFMHGNDKDLDNIKNEFDEMVNMTNPSIFYQLFEKEILVPGKGVKIIQAIFFPIKLAFENYLFGTVIRDITQSKAVEQSLRELIATKEKIFSVIAHDLRAPFNSIIGFSDLLLENIEKYDTESTRKIVQFINLSAKPTLDVLTNLLNWLNAQTGQIGFHPEPVHLKNMVKEVVEILNATAKIKNITLNQKLDDDFVIHADVNMLKSALQNLVVNAIKYSHGGGKVDICARKSSDCIEMEVADEGIGIEEQKKQSLFDMDAHESSKGTSGEKGSGLGLILCKEFIEMHGGEIRVESQPGEGSRFIFTVPLAEEEQDQ